MSLNRLLSNWNAEPGIAGNFDAVQFIPPRPARYEPLPDDLHPALKSALRASGIPELYSHQADAWRRAQNGEHLASFADVEDIEIRQSGGGGSPCTLNLRLHDGRELPIVSGEREDRLRALVDPIVRVSNASIHVTEREPAPPGGRRAGRAHSPRRQ